VKKKRGPKPLVCPPSVEAMLGVVADRNIAKETGFSHITIAKWRRERNIASLPRGGAHRKKVHRHRLFGLVPDAEIAAAEGVSRQRISSQRVEAEVPAPPHLTAYMAWSFLMRVVDEAKVGAESVTIPLDLFRAIEGYIPAKP